MAREFYRLSVAEINAAQIGDELEDGGGLRCFVVESNGKRTTRWELRYTSRVTGKRREAGLGSTTLKKARAKADVLRDEIKRGLDPLHERDKQAAAERDAEAQREREVARNAATLKACADEYYRSIVHKFRSRKHEREWLRSLEYNLPEKIWNAPVATLTTGDMLDAFLALYRQKPETARRVRQRCEVVLDRAALRGLCDRNVAALVKRELHKTVPRKRTSFRALDYRDVPRFLADLQGSERVGLAVRLCVLFTVACAARSGEARGATWGEVDLDARVWRVPAYKMKAGRAHAVHLSRFALDVLREAEALRDPKRGADALLFPAPRSEGRPLSDMALLMALRRVETGRTRDDGTPENYAHRATLHGFRSAFSGWGNEVAKARPDVVERCLAHAESNATRAAYLRVDFDKERAALLDKWGRFVATPEAAQVVPLRRAS